MVIPRLLIAGTHSGVGKTTVTLGLLQAFTARGLRVQPFKAGPDYIDPGYHTAVAGRPCRNLDAWLAPPARLAWGFQHACRGVDLAVIEGVMGLYDGIEATGEQGSTAELAKRLQCPVLLVVDVAASARSAAALVQGFVAFDRAVPVVGCVLNRVGGDGHARLVQAAIERATGVPVVGWLPRDPRLTLPERHLGLVPAIEAQSWRRILGPLAARVREGFNISTILRLARRAPPLEKGPPSRAALFSGPRVPIAVARDAAFHFYYPENLELLEAMGAELVPFSPLRDRRLPTGAGALYLGGGFPEVYAAALAANRPLRTAVARAVAAELPTYAECGGLMYLTQAITDTRGRRHPMAGVLPGEIRMTPRLQQFGYKTIRARRTSLMARPGESARGHEFHHSVWTAASPTSAAYAVTSAATETTRREGYARRNLLASYVHVHWGSQPRWAARFVRAARAWKRDCPPATAKAGRRRGLSCFLPVAVWLTAYGVSLTAFAEEPARMDEVVVTATKRRTPAKSVTRAVSVIPAEELSVVKGGFAADAFSDVSETLVRRSGSIGRTTAVVVRGASTAQVHVTMDGAHAASPTLGSFDFNHMTPDNLERMEILRGPGSVLYGSDAMGGVINLVTKRGEGPFTGSYTQEYGGLDTLREVIAGQGATGPWHLSGSLSRIDSDGLSQNDDYQNTNVSARVGYDVSAATTLDISLRHILAIVGLDDGAFRPDPNRRDRDRQTYVTGRVETQTTPWWSQTFRLSTFVGNLIDNDPSDGGSAANSLTKLDTERYGAEWLNRLTPTAWDTVTVGLEFEDREADRRAGGANANFSKTQTTRAVYLQNEWRPTGPLTVVTGARVFRESAFGADEVLEASAAYVLAPWGLKLRGGWGQGFRAPSLNELFFPNFGNPNLAAERSETYELGADQAVFDDRLQWSGTLFRTDYEDLIQIVRVSQTVSEPRNVGRSRVDGMELEVALRPTDPWRLTGSYTHLEAKERPSGEELLRIPKNTIAFSVGFEPSGARWGTRLEGLLVSRREESSATNQRNKTKGYLKFDVVGHYRFAPWAKGYLRVENLTNRTYSEVLGFPAAGTVASVGVTIER